MSAPGRHWNLRFGVSVRSLASAPSKPFQADAVSARLDRAFFYNPLGHSCRLGKWFGLQPSIETRWQLWIAILVIFELDVIPLVSGQHGSPARAKSS
jgi:hypothetical protein